MKNDTRTTRRSFVGGVTAVALVSACGGDGESDPAATGGSGGSGGSSGGSSGASGASGAGGTAGTSSDGGGCTLYPQQTEGPFFLDGDLVRSDITEGKPGTALSLTVIVLGGASCTPLAGVGVDIWQCDAAGVYSGYPNQLGGLDTTGETFLRGTQITDAEGRVVFSTIYPGWYPGRTTHIHVKVRPSPTSEATSQIYFPEDVTSTIYQAPPYDARGPKDTSNVADGVNAGNVPPLAALAPNGSGYDASLTITIAS